MNLKESRLAVMFKYFKRNMLRDKISFTMWLSVIGIMLAWYFWDIELTWAIGVFIVYIAREAKQMGFYGDIMDNHIEDEETRENLGLDIWREKTDVTTHSSDRCSF